MLLFGNDCYCERGRWYHWSKKFFRFDEFLQAKNASMIPSSINTKKKKGRPPRTVPLYPPTHNTPKRY